MWLPAGFLRSCAAAAVAAASIADKVVNCLALYTHTHTHTHLLGLWYDAVCARADFFRDIIEICCAVAPGGVAEPDAASGRGRRHVHVTVEEAAAHLRAAEL